MKKYFVLFFILEVSILNAAAVIDHVEFSNSVDHAVGNIWSRRNVNPADISMAIGAVLPDENSSGKVDPSTSISDFFDFFNEYCRERNCDDLCTDFKKLISEQPDKIRIAYVLASIGDQLA